MYILRIIILVFTAFFLFLGQTYTSHALDFSKGVTNMTIEIRVEDENRKELRLP